MVRICAASAHATAAAAHTTAPTVIHRAGPLTVGLVAPNTPNPPSSVPMMVTVRTTRSVAVSIRCSDCAGVSSLARVAQVRSASLTGRTGSVPWAWLVVSVVTTGRSRCR